MINKPTNELNRAVRLLNSEKENRSKAKNVLIEKYNIPQNNLSMLLQKIFYKLGRYNRSLSIVNNESLWEQFHIVATEELITLDIKD